MAKRLIGAFQLEKQLGVGGMGVVYLATYVKTGQKVALKVLSPGLTADERLVARFEREIAILKKLRHENIVQYYGGGKHGTQRYYAMELMDGGALEDELKRKEKLPWEQVIDYGLQICAGLEHAHNHGIVHRDLKPANLFLTKAEKIKIGDFGIARDTQATALTAAGKTVGTYAYMAPEQINGEFPISRKTDLYALGCVLYQMLCGRTPFVAENPAELLFQHIDGEPDRVTAMAIDCPVWLESVVMRLLEKNPQERYYDALAVHTALEEIGQQVARQTSISKHSTAGGVTALTMEQDRSELQKLLKKKKKKSKKKKNDVPIYERGWFLGACLLLMILGMTWMMLPLNEQQIYARAAELMESEDSADWRTAEEKYISSLQQRFPESKHMPQVQEWLDKIHTDRAYRQAKTAVRLSRDPANEGERFLIDAMKYEQEGDRISALATYNAMASILSESSQKELRPYILLAKQRSAEIEREQEGNVLVMINRTLARAEEFDRRGQLLKARNLWNSIITLYGTNQEFTRQVEYARSRYNGEDVEVIDFSLEQSDTSHSENSTDAAPEP